jgi:hypothetical protein
MRSFCLSRHNYYNSNVNRLLPLPLPLGLAFHVNKVSSLDK